MKKYFLVVSLLIASHAFAVGPFFLPWVNSSGPKEYHSTDHPTGVFVLHAFWSGCEWCHVLEPKINQMAAFYSSESRVQVLDVGVDREDGEYTKWVSSEKPNHPVLKDAARSLLSQLGTMAYPTTYIVDCRGNVRHQFEGGEPNEFEEKALYLAVDTLLKEDCHPTNVAPDLRN
jgi:hypothetical protein